MKATGIIRRIDALGRIVLAKEVRKSLNIPDNSELEITVVSNGVLVRKHSVGPGVVRPVDNLGRMVIPMEIRRSKGWDTGTALEMFIDGETIIYRKYQPGCVLCGEIDGDMSNIGGKIICAQCVGQIKQVSVG